MKKTLLLLLLLTALSANAMWRRVSDDWSSESESSEYIEALFCDVCQKDVEATSLKSHLENVHSMCHICRTVCDDRNQMPQHRREEHPKKNQTKPQALVQALKSVTADQWATAIEEADNNALPHKCLKCGKKKKSEEALKRHEAKLNRHKRKVNPNT